MAPARKIDLRLGEETWAQILLESDGRKILHHALPASRLESHRKLQPYENDARLSCEASVHEGPCVIFRDEEGSIRLELAEDDDGELFEVIDPMGEARLKLALLGPGAVAGEPVIEGWLALELCRVVSNPKVMMGKRVIRGTRITVELILRKLAAGSTAEDLLSDYPQITREDIREAILAAAKAERNRDSEAIIFAKTLKP